MEKELKFIKNVIKQFEKYKTDLIFKEVPNGIYVRISKNTNNESEGFNKENIEKFLIDIIINKKNKYLIFDNIFYAHPIKNLIKSLREFKLNEEEQCNILNKFFSYQNTHDFISADYQNEYFFKYIKSEEVKKINEARTYNHNNSLSSLSRELLDLHKKNKDYFNKVLEENLSFFIQNYNTNDQYGITHMSDLLIDRGTKELYENFNNLIKKNEEPNNFTEETKIDYFISNEKKEYVLKLDLEKIENKYLLFKSQVATELLKIILVDFFSEKNKDLHNIESSEYFTEKNNQKELITFIFTSDKDIQKENLKKDILFLIKFFDKKLNFNELPSSTYRMTNEFKEQLYSFSRSAIMNRDINESLNKENDSSTVKKKFKL